MSIKIKKDQQKVSSDSYRDSAGAWRRQGAKSPKGSTDRKNAITIAKQKLKQAAEDREAEKGSLPESSYSNIYNTIVEGFIKSRNKKAGRKNLIRNAELLGRSDRWKKGGKEGEDDTLRSMRSERQKKTDASDREFKSSGSTKEIKKKMEYRKKSNESLAYDIFDIICEGLVKAANKAKKNKWKNKLDLDTYKKLYLNNPKSIGRAESAKHLKDKDKIRGEKDRAKTEISIQRKNGKPKLP